MKISKYIFSLLVLSIFVYACGSSPKNIKTKNSTEKEEPVVIANDSLEYEIIIIDIGFTNYLNTVAQPRGFYSQKFLEIRNRVWVAMWNQRVQSPNLYNPSIYENIINYSGNIDYGYEVNYLLFNYFVFAQRKYNMNLGGGFGVRRIN